MEDHATIIPAYSPLDGIADGHWTYHPNDGGRDVAWSDDQHPDSWNNGWPTRRDLRKRNHLWNVKEVEKTAEIKDNFGFERFKVYLYASEEQVVLSSGSGDELVDATLSPDDITMQADVVDAQIDESKKSGWRVSVTAFLPSQKWELIFDSELLESLAEATRCYDENVREYSLIAKVETKHYQDIKIYAEKIGYHEVEECCANCRWCHKEPHKGPQPTSIRNDKLLRELKSMHQKLVCHNYKLFAKRVNDVERPDFDQTRIQPEVQPFCVCSHFEKQLPPHDPAFPNHCRDQYGDELPMKPQR